MGNYLQFEDLSSPTAPFNFGLQSLRNLSGIVIGANTSSSYNIDAKNGQPITNFTGYEKGVFNIENGNLYAGNTDKYLGIDFTYELNFGKPQARIGCQLTDTGTFLNFGTSVTYTTGITNIDMITGYFTTEATNGIKVKDSILFSANNVGSIGTSSVAVANIYSVNALNVTSDNNEKKDINKNIPLGLDFVKLVANTAIATYSWKDTETEKHSRTRFGFLGVELYNAIIQSGLDTKKCAFLSVYDEDQIYRDEKNVLTGEIKENKKKKPFEVKLTKEGRPKGKITIQPTEMLPILFKAITEQSEQIEALKAEIEILKLK